MDVTKQLKFGVISIILGIVATAIVLSISTWPDPQYHQTDCFIQDIIETPLYDTISLRIEYNYTDNKGEHINGLHYKECARDECLENTYETFPVGECVDCFYNDAHMAFKQPLIGITFFIVFGPMLILVGLVFLFDYCREKHPRPPINYLLNNYTNL